MKSDTVTDVKIGLREIIERETTIACSASAGL